MSDALGSLWSFRSYEPAVKRINTDHMVRSSVLGFSAIFNRLIRHNFVRDMSVGKGTENATKHNESRWTPAKLAQALHQEELEASTIR